MKLSKVISFDEALELVGNRIVLESLLQQGIIRYRIGSRGIELQLEDVLNYKILLEQAMNKLSGVEISEQEVKEPVADSLSVDLKAVEGKKKAKSS